MTVSRPLQPFRNPRVLRGAVLCVRAAVVKEIANTVADSLKTQLAQSSAQTVDAIIDDYCGTPSPPKIRNPWSVPSAVA